ncbi:MAG: hypothetical protein ACOYT4_04875 [Nanoarchaeota archaeon]
MIDSHVHCRDWNESLKETIGRALDVAKDSGLSAIFDMPNTNPVLSSRELAVKRLESARKINSPLFYGIFIALTHNVEQVEDAVKTYNEFFPQDFKSKQGVIGLKEFTTNNIECLNISKIEQQKDIFRWLVKFGFDGVLAKHCEKASLINHKKYNPDFTLTHSYARPKLCETESIRDQIRLALETGYALKGGKGKLHILHVSTPTSVNIIKEAKKYLNISCETTPHYLLLNEEIFGNSDQDGEENVKNVYFKVNPPLRDKDTQEELFEKFKEGLIDTLATDHAPHTTRDKFYHHMSGIASLASWQDFLMIFKKLRISNHLLENVTHDNVNKIFGTNIPKLNLEIASRGHIARHGYSYGIDPFARVKVNLGLNNKINYKS